MPLAGNSWGRFLCSQTSSKYLLGEREKSELAGKPGSSSHCQRIQCALEERQETLGKQFSYIQVYRESSDQHTKKKNSLTLAIYKIHSSGVAQGGLA